MRRQTEADKAVNDRVDAARKLSEAEAKAALKVSYEYTQSDLDSCMRKLTDAAVKYDRNSAGAVGLDAFEGAEMTPVVFKEQLKRVFNIRLSPPELGAMMHYFDRDGDGTVNCSEFVIQFFKRGFEERSNIIRRRRALQELLEKRRVEEEGLLLLEGLARAAMKVDYNYSRRDFDSAMLKLTDAAVKYSKRSAGTVGLDAFEGAEMTPAVFKEQLKRVFNIRLSPQELGALMHYFDKDGDGTVQCSEFLIQFFKKGAVSC